MYIFNVCSFFRIVDEVSGIDHSKISINSSNLENVPVITGPPKMQVLCPPSLPPRIERRRENEKKLAKQKGKICFAITFQV